ncbi:MAG TPA: lytic murein transglycosylase [Pseudorhodoplanes sp.]|nr:lytic murein transglycosylase [Pseudorhodoplanes sp.]
MAFVILLCCGGHAAAQSADDFQQWLRSLWPEAQRLGISRKVFDEATRGLEPDLRLPDLVIHGRPDKPAPGQAEFVQTPADYLNERSLARLTEHGRSLAATHRDTLARIEKEFGVPGPVVLAIWGRETDFGRYKLPHNALRVLATQGYVGRRKDYFRQEFLVAIKMIDDGLARPADMRSSWGGAMGLTQFLPSEFYKHGVDFDGDGRADIFNSVPDALASAAKQLAAKGWQRGERWAYEVRAPGNFDCTQGVPEVVKPMRDWLRLGFVPAYDRKLSALELSQPASVLQPEGARGPAFLTPKNYFVIKEYNFSDLYVLFVGQLSDRIAGGRGFEQPWGKTSQLRTVAVEEMQTILTTRGLYASKVDGKAGMQTRSALGAYQKANRLPLDCWPSGSVLDHMKGKAGRN